MTGGSHRAQRSCIACRKVKTQDQLVRYVLAPDGTVVIDYRQRLPGRGAYTCLERQCLEQAVRRGQFARAFRRPLEKLNAGELAEDLRRQIAAQILGLLAVARKAGQVVSGSALVLTALGSKTSLGLVLIARDASAGIAEKVSGKARVLGVGCQTCFDKESLGQVLGKEERSVVAIKQHPLAESLMEELVRYTHIAGEC